MATSTHGDPRPVRLTPNASHTDEERWDECIDVLLSVGDLEGSRAELERQCLASLDSGEPILMTPEKWKDLRLELHREANVPS